MEHFSEWIELTALAIEILAVAIMVGLIAIGTMRWLMEPAAAIKEGYRSYRLLLGKTLLVGLELLVAADIIRTVAVDLTLLGIGTLGLLVVVRTFLGWTITVEIEGRWPWQPEKETGKEARDGA